MKWYLALVSVLCSGVSVPAVAQDGWGWSVIIPSVTGTDQLGLHLRDQLARQKSVAPAARVAPSARGAPPASGTLPDRAAPPATAADGAVLRYVPSKARRADNLKNFVDRASKADSADARQLQALFASGDIIDKMGSAMKPLNLRVDDLADVYTLWWITMWQATRGTNEDFSRQTGEAVRRQSQQALVAVPMLAGAGEAAKQEMAEGLLLQAMMIDAAVEQAKKNPDQLRAVSNAAAQGARGMGVEMSTMELTETGFVLK